MSVSAAAYVRYSSDNQRDESIDAQVRAIQQYAKSNNLEIVKVYADRAKSATSDKRPEFQKMILESASGLFNFVIVHKLDRFSRDRYDSASYKRKLKKNGIRLLSVTEHLDNSPESVIMESLLEGMAEYYSKNLAREVMKGMIETALKCQHTGGIPPLGYDVGPEKKYIINEQEAIIVRTIFDMYLNGHGYGNIVRHLNGMNYKTKIGRPFGKNSLHDILANEKYSGTYVYNRASSKDAFGIRNNHLGKPDDQTIRIKGGMPAIISKEDFAATKAKMTQNKKAPGAYKSKETYLLSGLIFCGDCGHAMQGNSRLGGRNKEKYVTYRCGNRDRTQTCSNKEIRKEYIEAFVLSELEKKLLNDTAIPHLVKMLNEHLTATNASQSEELRCLTANLEETKKQIDNIVSAITQGFTQDSFKEKITELEEEKAHLEVKLHELQMKSKSKILTEEEIRRLFSVFKKFVAEKNIPECKRFISNYVEKVLVFQDRVEVTLKVAIEDDNSLQLTCTNDKITKRHKKAGRNPRGPKRSGGTLRGGERVIG